MVVVSIAKVEAVVMASAAAVDKMEAFAPVAANMAALVVVVDEEDFFPIEYCGGIGEGGRLPLLRGG